jgi:hypothetical protein
VAVYGDAPVLICNRADVPGTEPLLNRLDFRSLYNRLAEIRTYAGWPGDWSSADLLVLLSGQGHVPVEVVVRTMTVIQTRLEATHYETWEAFVEATPLPDQRLFEEVMLLQPTRLGEQ